MRRLSVVLLGVALAAGAVALAVGPAGATRASSSMRRAGVAVAPPLPTSMAALGDSITEAYDSLGTVALIRPEPQFSWATGYAGVKIVDSQYLRLLAGNPAIRDHEHNDSVVGANVSGLAAQVAVAVKQKVKYVTILIGANDLCTNAISAMTPVGTFAQTFASDLAALFKGLPAGAHVSVYSIPNLFLLWELFNTNKSAEYAWSFGICQSMLSPANTPADRTTVLNREKAFNNALAKACKKYPTCRWDNLAVFNEKLTAGSVSFDYFHPSLRGQAQLAQITWATSWWPSAK